jgi:hypothetical protein
MGKVSNDQTGFSAVEVLLGLIFVAIVVFIGVYVAHNRNSSNKTTASTTPTTTPSTTATPTTHTSQEAVAFVQKTYDDYLAALNQANSDTSNTKPVAQVGLSVVKANLAPDLYAKAAAVTQATPFSCTAQFVTDKYTASLSSSDKTSAVVAVSISNGGGQNSNGMTASVDLTSLKITSVTCPS